MQDACCLFYFKNRLKQVVRADDHSHARYHDDLLIRKMFLQPVLNILRDLMEIPGNGCPVIKDCPLLLIQLKVFRIISVITDAFRKIPAANH